MIANIVSLWLVLHHHLVPALAAVNDSVEQRLARTGHPSGLVAVVFAAIVPKHALNRLEGRPVDVGRVLVVDPDLPFSHGELLLDTLKSRPCLEHGARPPIDEGPCISGVLQGGADRRDSPPAPDD